MLTYNNENLKSKYRIKVNRLLYACIFFYGLIEYKSYAIGV